MSEVLKFIGVVRWEPSEPKVILRLTTNKGGAECVLTYGDPIDKTVAELRSFTKMIEDHAISVRKEEMATNPEAQNIEMKRVMNRVLAWLENRGDATHDHGVMHPCQIASAAREWLKREGIELG